MHKNSSDSNPQAHLETMPSYLEVPSHQEIQTQENNNTTFIYKLIKYKTPFDKSEYSCLENFIRGSASSFALGYAFKAVIGLVQVLFGLKSFQQAPSKIIEALINRDNIRFGGFMGLFTGILKLTISLLRVLRKKDDGITYFVAGFFAAYFSLFLNPKRSRAIWGLFLLPRAFDCIYNHLVNSGKIKKRVFHYPLLFALINMFTVYGYSGENYLIPSSIERFYTQVMNGDEFDLTIRQLFFEMVRRRLKKKGIIKDLCLPIEE